MLFIQACIQSGDSQNLEEVTKLLTQYSTDWSEAIKSGDASEVVDLFATDFMYHSENGDIVFRDEFIKNINENRNPIESYELKDIKVHLFETDLANVTGAFNTIWINQNGVEQLYKTRFTNVWKKNSGKWQCIIGHSNPLILIDNEAEVANQLMRIWEGLYEGMNNKDIDKVMSYFTEDYINYPSYGSTQIGYEQTKPFLNSFIENRPYQEMDIEQIEVKVLGDFAFEVVKDENQRGFSIFQKQSDGSWKFYRWNGQQKN
jgi:ketosteroid isomerase-like protein